MPTAEKATAIEQAKDWYQRSKGVVFTDYRGLKVKDMQALRANLRAKGGELHVIKNTLFRIAAGEDTDQLPAEFHNGPTAIAFFFENETECAKVLFDYAKVNKTFEVKGGFIAGKTFSAAQVESFSKLPPRDVLIAQVIGAIAAPLSNLVGVIEALYADPIRVIGAVADKVAKESPTAAASTSSAEVAAVPATVAEAPADVSAEAASEEPVAEEATEAGPAEVNAEAASEAAPAEEATVAESAPAEVEALADEAPTEESTNTPQE